MKNLKSLFLLTMTILFVGTMSVRAEGNEPKSVAVPTVEKGEVVVLNQAGFISKVCDYKKNKTNWVYVGTKPCIIDFYADWCGPCRQMAPIMKELAKQYAGRVVFYKMNVDNEKEIASLFGIQSIPTFLFVPMKNKPQIAQGAIPKEELVKAIDSFLLGKASK